MRRIMPEIDRTRTTNFDIDLNRKVNVHDGPQKESVPYVELSISVEGDNPSAKIKVALSKLETTDWTAIDPRAVFEPGIALTKAKRYIAADIHKALDDLPESDVYRLKHPGTYKINGTVVFCTGGGVILPPTSVAQKPEIECERMSQRLDFDPDLSEGEAAAEMFNLISLFPDPGRIIFSQVLVAFMRQAYIDAGKAPSFCVFLYGASGTQKSTLASFLTQVYNRNEGIAAPTRLSASIASAVDQLMTTVDQVLVFDDLFPSDSKQVRQKQEELLSEITRYIGDGTIPARLKGGTLRQGRPKCGVLFTGEYLIGEGSDAARILPVKMTKPDTVALRDFQERPLVLSTFYRNFISWFVENYDEIVSYLRRGLDEYCKTDVGVHDRLRETHFFLNTAYSLALEYCGKKGVLEEADVRRLQNGFAGLLTHLVQEQNKRVSPTPTEVPAPGDVLARIRELYRRGEFSIPKDKKQFDCRYHQGVIHKGCLCLKSEALSALFPSSNIKDIVQELDAQGALDKGTKGDKKKISAASGNYFYWIQLSCLS